MGVKALVNVGTLSPLPEQLLEFLLVFGFDDVEAALFEGEAFGDEFAAAQGDDVSQEVASLTEVEVGVIGDGSGLGGGGEAQGGVIDELIDQDRGAVLGRGARIVFSFGGEVESVLAQFQRRKPYLR